MMLEVQIPGPNTGLYSNGGLMATCPIGVDGDTQGFVYLTRASENREKSEPKETG
jgi:hypothetical protein